MSQISKVYRDYENQPYISDDRNLKEWETYPEKFPYSKVERKQMVPVEEGLFPGDIVMLWRIGFNNFTNETWMPDYFEYRYGINPSESIARLIEGGFIMVGGAIDSVVLLNAASIKRILKEKGLPVSGKKQDLVDRLLQNVEASELEQLISLRRYIATPSGLHTIAKYDSIIQSHGPKSL